MENIIEKYVNEINENLLINDVRDCETQDCIKTNLSFLIEKLEVLNIVDSDSTISGYIDILKDNFGLLKKLKNNLAEPEKNKVACVLCENLSVKLEEIQDYTNKILNIPQKKFDDSNNRIVDLSGNLDVEMENEIFMDFFSEADEHLNNFESMVMRLETNPKDIDAINESFRGIHSIKGLAGFLNLIEINKLTHIVESLLDFLRDGLEMQDEFIDAFFKTIDVLRNLISNVSDKLEGKEFIFDKQNFDNVYETISEIIETIKHKNQKIESRSEKFLKTSNDDPVRSIETSFSSFNKTINSVPEKLENTKKISDTIKVKIDKIDGLVNFIGELVIIHNQIVQRIQMKNDDTILMKNVSQMNRIISELQETSLSMRMVPVKATFQKLNRMTRELSRQTGKKVECSVLGESTELDRNVIEELQDPLVHIIRNSIDHGIEKPEIRVKCGKPETGTIKLNAFHQNGMVIIEIIDDGKGLNKDLIYKKAISSGLIQNNEKLIDNQIYKLIFNPGFSTAEKVTNISGRGVGMDVVKQNIDKIRGKIDVKSTENKGCKIQIKLPLTLAIIDGMIVRVGNEKYILPMLSILESISSDNKNVNILPDKNEVIKVRNKIYPLVRLNKLLGNNKKLKDIKQGIIIIIQVADRSFALLVDELVGQHQIVIKNLGKTFNDIKMFSGAAIMGDGKVGLILNVEHLSMCDTL